MIHIGAAKMLSSVVGILVFLNDHPALAGTPGEVNKI